MATRTIVTAGDPILRKRSRPVTVFDARLHTLLDDMAETLTQANGYGLAAVQVGVLRRAVLVFNGEELIELINPVITERSEATVRQQEGCLSFPGKHGIVERPKKVTVQAQDRHGNLIFVTGEDIVARAFCHEVDHLNGILFHDLAESMLEDE